MRATMTSFPLSSNLIKFCCYFQELQSVPILKTTHECGQEIKKSSYLTSSTCTETHVYRPFSNDNSGGMTRVIQSLTYSTYKYETKALGNSFIINILQARTGMSDLGTQWVKLAQNGTKLGPFQISSARRAKMY